MSKLQIEKKFGKVKSEYACGRDSNRPTVPCVTQDDVRDSDSNQDLYIFQSHIKVKYQFSRTTLLLLIDEQRPLDT